MQSFDVGRRALWLYTPKMIDDSITALKRQLADEILRVHSQTHVHVAAMALGIDVPRLSDLRRGRLKRFSVERLIRLLAIVDRRVELTIVTVGPEQVRWSALIATNLRRRPTAEALATGPRRQATCAAPPAQSTAAAGARRSDGACLTQPTVHAPEDPRPSLRRCAPIAGRARCPPSERRSSAARSPRPRRPRRVRRAPPRPDPSSLPRPTERERWSEIHGCSDTSGSMEKRRSGCKANHEVSELTPPSPGFHRGRWIGKLRLRLSIGYARRSRKLHRVCACSARTGAPDKRSRYPPNAAPP